MVRITVHERKSEAFDYSRASTPVAKAYELLDDYFCDDAGALRKDAVEKVLLTFRNDRGFYDRSKLKAAKSYSLAWDALLDEIQATLEWDDEFPHATKLSSEQVKNWFKLKGRDFKEDLKPLVDAIDKQRNTWDESKKSESSGVGVTGDVIHILSTAYDTAEPYGFVNDGVGTIIADFDSDDKVSFECWLYPYVVSDIMRGNDGDREIENYFKDMCDAMESSLDGTSLKYFKSLGIDRIVRGNHCIHVDFSVPMDVVLDLIASTDDPVQTLKDARDEAVDVINKVWTPYCDDILENGTKYITPKKARCEVGLNAEESKKSEAYEDIWRGAKVVSYENAADYIDLPAEEEQEIIDKYGKDYYDNPNAMDEYSEALDDYIVAMFDQDFVYIDGDEIPLAVCREPKILIVQTIDHKDGDKAVELVKKLAKGELKGTSEDGDFVAIMDGVNGNPHFDIYSA